MKDVIRLEIGEPDMDTPLHVKEAAKKALDEGFTHYTPFSGFEDLREAIAEKVKVENGIKADPERGYRNPGCLQFCLLRYTFYSES